MSAFRKSGGFGGGNRPGGFRPGGRPPFNNDRGGFGGGESRGGSGERFSAVCADCGQTCDVPFRPNGKKPVYCRECFPKHHSDTRGNDRPSFERREVPRNFERRDSYAPPAPRAAAGPDPRIDSLAREISMLGTKIDSLTRMLEKVAPKAETAPAAAPKVEKTEKSEKKPAAKKVAKKAAKKAAKK